ncbi:MAG: precorrin-6y C5,15-methyltransferase (decarboxylating) subunit CbiE [Chloroflexota bacterium]
MSEADIVHVVGIGANGRPSLPSSVQRIVDAADVLCGSQRQLGLFPEHRGERFVVTADTDALVARLRSDLGTRRVVVLASGDPGFYGIGPILAHRLGAQHVAIHPSPSSISLAFARIGESWADATIISAHGRPLEAAVTRAVAARKLAFFTDELNTPAVISRALLRAGVEDARAWVFERIGSTAERITAAKLSEIEHAQFDPLNVLVVLRDHAPRADHTFGRPDDAFEHSAGMITHAEVRAMVLSKLRLRGHGVLWDVGAGSGSVAIEAAELVPDLAAFAVEQSLEQVGYIRSNVARHHLEGRVQIIHGTAPSCLKPLPPPDAVFVGGSGGHLVDVLQECWQRLNAGGTIVASFATLENVTQMVHWGRANHAWLELIQVAISRGRAVGDLTRLAALNPVFVCTIRKQVTRGSGA